MGLKARAMHLLVGLGLEPLVLAYWRLKGQSTEYLQGSRQDRFRRIYAEGQWTNEDLSAESLSGRGSTLSATAGIRSNLPAMLQRLGASALLDIGCGDFNWMRAIDLPCPYIGVDIVPEVIASNQKQYADGKRSFLVLDAVAEPLPKADVALCREVLFHLSLKDAKSLLENARRSGVRYLLATSDPTVTFNADIPTGAWRDINLELSPYGLGRAIESIEDSDGPNPNRILGVWKL